MAERMVIVEQGGLTVTELWALLASVIGVIVSIGGLALVVTRTVGKLSSKISSDMAEFRTEISSIKKSMSKDDQLCAATVAALRAKDNELANKMEAHHTDYAIHQRCPSPRNNNNS